MTTRAQRLRQRIIELTKAYSQEAFGQKLAPGNDYIPASGKVFDEAELTNLVDASLDFWLTEGRFNEAFEVKLAQYLGLKFVTTVNSGSSANLLAFYALTSEKLGRRAIQKGDEVVEVATCFPTTLNPVVQFGARPVLVDVSLPTYNALAKDVITAAGPKTKAVFLAHTLGNPYEVKEIADFCRQKGIWLIEDCCDALGAKYRGKKVGTFGDLATLSFYPAHQITTGEGGAVLTNDALLNKIVRSFRDWGRDCWCHPGKENTCGVRFKWQLGQLPAGYDHKYIYSHIGFNLKMTDMQAAVGAAQMDKLPRFIKTRRQNHARLNSVFQNFSDYFILPQATPDSQPSWFGFVITVKETAPFSRAALVQFLESKRIGTRGLFGGNITRQPAYGRVKFRIPKPLRDSDLVMNNSFWIGCYPAINNDIINYIGKVTADFIKNRRYESLG